jgi:hypothetical protein
MSYALSDNIQDAYTSPLDLRQRWWQNYANSAKLWYAVSFPGWKGYRVEHDPTYTAFFGVAGEEPIIDDSGPCASSSLIFVGAICIPWAKVVSNKKKRKKTK